ncbi:MAG TPA: protease inhibitor I42 family protein [Phycisphaerae bacterium]|jgi:predicted secreted protein|nr:protease inhibitor I42 family protein [Phycisphaerae bacterium]
MISLRIKLAFLAAVAQLLIACNAPTAPSTAPALTPAATRAAASMPGAVLATSPSTAPAAQPLLLTDADNGRTLQLNNIDTVTINLNGNITTGYSWSLAGITGPAVESLGEPAYIRAQPGAVGSGGVFIARFRVAHTGQSQVTLQYARPWEKTNPARTFTVTLMVDKLP